MRKEEGGRGQPRPLSLMPKPKAMAKAKAPKRQPGAKKAGKQLGLSRPKSDSQGSEPEQDALSVCEARKRARQRVYESADTLVSGLIEKGKGNYLTVKFLFEFAGLAGDGMDEEEEDSPVLKAYLERLQKDAQQAGAEQTPEAKLNLCSDGDSQICR